MPDRHRPDHDEEQQRRAPSPTGEDRHGDERHGQQEGGQDGGRVEPDAPPRMGEEEGRLRDQGEPAEERRPRQELGERARGRLSGMDFARDRQTGGGADEAADDTEEVGRAPQGDVETEEPVPEIIDGRREHDEAAAPRRKLKAPCPRMPTMRTRLSGRPPPAVYQASMPQLSKTEAATPA